MAWDQAAYEAQRKREEDICHKLEITSDEGSEIGEAAAHVLEFLQSSSAGMFLGDEAVEPLWEAADEACNRHFEFSLGEAEHALAYGHIGSREVLELQQMNQKLKEAGLKEYWPEGYVAPTVEELEAAGKCADHPHQGDYTAPRNGCDRCIRLYVAAEDRRKEEAKERAARRAARGT